MARPPPQFYLLLLWREGERGRWRASLQAEDESERITSPTWSKRN